MFFQRSLAWNESQAASSWIRTRVIDSISYDENHYDKSSSKVDFKSRREVTKKNCCEQQTNLLFIQRYSCICLFIENVSVRRKFIHFDRIICFTNISVGITFIFVYNCIHTYLPAQIHLFIYSFVYLCIYLFSILCFLFHLLSKRVSKLTSYHLTGGWSHSLQIWTTAITVSDSLPCSCLLSLTVHISRPSVMKTNHIRRYKGWKLEAEKIYAPTFQATSKRREGYFFVFFCFCCCFLFCFCFCFLLF